MSDQYYYITDGDRQGPVPVAELKILATRQILKRTDKIWKEGMTSWQLAETLPEIFQGLPPDIENPLKKPAESIPPPNPDKQNAVLSAGGLAALSFILPGVGQMVCGQTAKGTFFLIIAIGLDALTGGLIGLNRFIC